MMAAASSGASARARQHLSGARIEELGRLVQPPNVVLDPREILDAWQIPSKGLAVEVGTVPVALMQAIGRDPRVLHQVDPRQFEVTVAEILARHGFRNVNVTPRSGDGGRDVEAQQTVAGIPIRFYFECRQHGPDKPVQINELRALLGVVMHGRANKGVLVTTSRFTTGGLEFIAENAYLDGKDYDDLVAWIAALELG